MSGYLFLIVILMLFALLAIGVWVGVALAATGMVGLIVLGGETAGALAATSLWSAVNSWSLTAMPLFLLMGEILFRSRLADDLFDGLSVWVGRLPGKLLHVNVLACGILAAIVGSSSVCAATVGRMSVPELKRQGYDDSLVIGTLAGSGTLGLLIPPSIMMIIYGAVSQVSVAKLFLAGIIPGLIIMFLFSSYVAVQSLLHPGKTPATTVRVPFAEKLRRTRKLIPAIVLISCVLGTIYAGLATPTEAAAIGVIGSLAIGTLFGKMNWTILLHCIRGGVTNTVLIMFVLAGASVLSAFMDYSSLPRIVAELVLKADLSAGSVLLALMALYLFLGCFLDGASMILATAAVVLPVVAAVGIDLLWFGIFLVILIEIAQITPPVGFNLYILQALTGKDILVVTKASMPFFFLLLLGLLILWLAPQTVSYLPGLMVGR